MKYIVRGDDGKEYGPVDEETLRKWTEAGRVLPHTQIRNTLIRKWNKATDFDFLKPSFTLQHTRVEEEKGGMQKFSERLDIIFGGRKKTPETITPYATAFKNKYIPEPASFSLRMMSVFFDFIIIMVYAFALLVFFSFSVPMKMQEQPKPQDAAAQQEAPAPDVVQPATMPAPEPAAAAAAPAISPLVAAEVNAAFGRSFYLLVLGVLLYYGIALGLFAQTFGMWFWGIMISRMDLGEVFLGRAYFFTVLMFLLGILSPLFVLFNPFRRTLPEMLSGTMIIRVAAKPKI